NENSTYFFSIFFLCFFHAHCKHDFVNVAFVVDASLLRANLDHVAFDFINETMSTMLNTHDAVKFGFATFCGREGKSREETIDLEISSPQKIMKEKLYIAFNDCHEDWEFALRG
ncbi:hypothetical protein PFISCL1PPCAC_25290, partial [Pristionchus fissidentatus]